MRGLLAKLTRKKPLAVGESDTSLQRCLTTFDLTLIGIGGMVGSGIYVMTGVAAKQLAGPAIVVSFLLAAVVILLVVVCFIEFASRVHKTGTTYLYAYSTLGELPAFLIGWAILLTSVFGAATNARAWSAYLDFLTGHAVADYLRSHVADWSSLGPPLGPHPDLLAGSVAVLLSLVVAGGASCSARVNSAFALVNVAVLVFFIVVGFTFADVTNWTGDVTPLAASETNVTTAVAALLPARGFLPYGWLGALRGAGVCFWAFTGFEAICVSVEEARNPSQSIPLASAVALVAVTALYVATAAALTLVAPVASLDVAASLPSALAGRGLVWAGRVAAAGPLFGITTTTLGSLFAFARVAYAVAADGLLCPVFARVHACARVPLAAVVVCGTIVALLAVFVDISDLLGFGILLCLVQYAVVALSVVMLRYRPHPRAEHTPGSVRVGVLRPGQIRLLAPLARLPPGRWVYFATIAVTVIMLPLSAAILHIAAADSAAYRWTMVLVAMTLVVVCVGLAFTIGAHQQNEATLTLQVPCVPLVPLMAIFGCSLLFVSVATTRNIIGLMLVFILGLTVYFSYGCRHSRLNEGSMVARPLGTETIGLLDIDSIELDPDSDFESSGHRNPDNDLESS